jgi:hypothetical protein
MIIRVGLNVQTTLFTYLGYTHTHNSVTWMFYFPSTGVESKLNSLKQFSLVSFASISFARPFKRFQISYYHQTARRPILSIIKV